MAREEWKGEDRRRQHQDPLHRIAEAIEWLVRNQREGGAIEKLQRSVDQLGHDVRRIMRMEVEQMAFAQDVLAKITQQTTLIGSIKVWIQNLPTDVVTAEEKAAIIANLDANERELSTAIPANVPPVA